MRRPALGKVELAPITKQLQRIGSSSNDQAFKTLLYLNLPNLMQSLRPIRLFLTPVLICLIVNLQSLPLLAAKKLWTLVEDGVPRAVIVLDREPSLPARVAAKELVAYIEKVTGVELPVVNPKTLAAKDAPPIRILVGESELTRKYGLKSADFDSQEYAIEYHGKDLVILGRDTEERGEDTYSTDGLWPGATLFSKMGTLYAAHTFLEKYVGVRWYLPGEIGEVYPQTLTLRIKPQNLRTKPWTEYRWSSRLSEPDPFDFYAESDAAAYKPRVPTKKEMNLFLVRLKVGGDRFSVNHSYTGWFERFGKIHPEWWLDSKPAPTAHLDYLNPMVIAQTVKEAREYLDGKLTEQDRAERKIFAGGEYFSIMPLDASYGWVRSPEAVRLINPAPPNRADMIPTSRIFPDGFFTGWMSDYWFTVINRAAGEIRQTNPKAWISTCAYSSYALPPDFPLEPNVAVCVTGESVTSFRPENLAFFQKLHQDWSQKTKRLFVWEYYLTQTFSKFKHFPVIFPRHVAEGIRHLREAGVRGMFFESSGSPGLVANPAEQMLNRYFTWKLLADDSLDPKVMLEEFFTGFFGPAAVPMKAFLSGIETRWETLADSKPTRSALRRSWHNLCPPPVLEELGQPMRAALAMDLPEPYARRVRLFNEAIYQPMLVHANAYYSRQNTDRLLACPTVAKAPVIDGKKETLWGQAPKSDAFRTVSNEAAGFQTTAAFLHDDKNLYFLVDCEEPKMDQIRATVRVHDNLNIAGDDDVELFLDVGQTGQKYYHIIVNTTNTICDRAVGMEFGNGGLDWESGVRTSVKKRGDGFVIEGAIPLKSLGVTSADLAPGTLWGMNIGRRRTASGWGKDVFTAWAPTYGGFNTPEEFGILKFVKEVR